MNKLVIGLTGGIGSGKTAASDRFEALGITVVDADIVAREVVEPGRPALNEISEHFGPLIISDDGSLDRRQLREIIFNNADEKKWLEHLLHPLIREEIISQLNNTQSPYAILVSPLLFETNQHLLTERTLLIDIPSSLQIERAMSRDQANADQIKKIIEAQMPQNQKQELADDIIVNEHDMRYLHEQIDAQHDFYLELANDREKTT